MSLTSYQTAPPRVNWVLHSADSRLICLKGSHAPAGAKDLEHRNRLIGVSAVFHFADLRRPGSDLLSHTLRCSTIGAEAFHGRVRDGIGCFILAITTRSSEIRRSKTKVSFFRRRKFPLGIMYRRLSIRALKPIEQLVLVSFTHHCASTPSLSTWWSTTVLKGNLVLRWVSRLDAFSGYPVRT